MTAICGVIRDHVGAHALDACMAELGPYGLDGSAVTITTHAALGHQTTHLTPESAGHSQPARHAVVPAVITGDLRLDNRNDLIDRLSMRSTSASDAEIVLEGWVRWGERCVEYLLGDFAFAIWDEARRQLFCARDSIGTRPFYYAATPGQFAFASDIAALLAIDGVSSRLDLASVRARLLYRHRHYDRERTYHQDIRKLPAGSTLTVDGERRTLRTYWQPRVTEDAGPVDPSDVAERLHELVALAVADRTRSSQPTGSHLSAGLDSTFLTALAARIRPDHRAYTLSAALDGAGPEWAGFAEATLVTRTAETFGVPLTYTNLRPEDAAAALLTDLTVGQWGYAPEGLAAANAAGHGVRVVLSGNGGDEAFSFDGRDRLHKLRDGGHRLQALLERLRLARYDGRSRARIIGGTVAKPLKRGLGRRARPAAVASELPATLTPEFADALAAAEPLEPDPLRIPGDVDGRAHLLDTGYFHERIDTWARAGRSGITYAYPLLDRRVLDFVLGLPASVFVHDGWRRWPAREALRGLVPDEIRLNPAKTSPHDASADISAEDIHRAARRLIRERRTEIESIGIVDVDKLLEDPGRGQGTWLAGISRPWA